LNVCRIFSQWEAFLILTAEGKTDLGRMRDRNEDFIHVDEKLGLLVVADGIGGRSRGEVASELAVRAVREYFRTDHQAIADYDPAYSVTTNQLNTAVMQANRAVYEAAQTSPDLEGMGTTIAACLLANDQLSFAHVGDSRIYLIRSGNMELLTADHSFAGDHFPRQRLTGERTSLLFKNILTRAVGVGDEVVADLGELNVLAGDLLLLCSDGLYNMIPDSEMLQIILRAGNVRAASEILTDIANDNGGSDNISAIVGYIHKKKWRPSWAAITGQLRR